MCLVWPVASTRVVGIAKVVVCWIRRVRQLVMCDAFLELPCLPKQTLKLQTTVDAKETYCILRAPGKLSSLEIQTKDVKSNFKRSAGQGVPGNKLGDLAPHGAGTGATLHGDRLQHKQSQGKAGWGKWGWLGGVWNKGVEIAHRFVRLSSETVMGNA